MTGFREILNGDWSPDFTDVWLFLNSTPILDQLSADVCLCVEVLKRGVCDRTLAWACWTLREAFDSTAVLIGRRLLVIHLEER